MKILFVFHEARLTGATLALFTYVKWLHKHTDISVSFLLKERGEMEKEISLLGKVYVWEPLEFESPDIYKRIKNKILKAKSKQEMLIDSLKKESFDTVYFNTVLCSGLIKKLSCLNSKIIWHIHELELAVNFVGRHLLDAHSYTHAVVANSESTQQYLINNGINKEKIFVSYPGIDFEMINQLKNDAGSSECHIPDDAFVIGTSGTVLSRKGWHNFIELPSIINHLLADNSFYYVWVGKISKADKEIIKYDIQKSGNNAKIIFTDEQKNPFPIYKRFDVFVSVSKEESFGMAAVELAFMHKPIVCFQNTGGIEELVNKAHNISVPYLDSISLGKVIIDLYKNPEKRIQLGNAAYEHIKEYDINKIMPRFHNFLNQVTIA